MGDRPKADLSPERFGGALLQTRKNLILACESAKQGQYQNVSPPLKEAAAALDSYSALNSSHANEAKQLSQDIRSYTSSLNSHSDHSAAVNKIEGWWQQTHSWTSSR
jgi:hypothetical protein